MGQNAILQQLISLQRRVGSLETDRDAQRDTIKRMGRGLQSIARLAGAEGHLARVVLADIDNPANPVAAPGSESSVATTDESISPSSPSPVHRDQPAGGNSAQELFDVGTVPGTTEGVPADAVTTVEGTRRTAEEVLPPEPAATVDVTKPVSGTEGPLPLDQVKIESDVVAEEPSTDVAYPVEGPFAEQKKTTGSARFFASMRLARLRVQAGIANGDDIAIGQEIFTDASLSNAQIQHDISTLEAVKTASRPAQADPQARGLVPQIQATAAMTGAASMQTPQPESDPYATTHKLGSYSGAAVSNEEFLFD